MAVGTGRKRKTAYRKKQDKMTPEQKAHRAEKMRLYAKRNRRKTAGKPLEDVPLEGEAVAPGDESLEAELENANSELVKACEALQKEMPELELRVAGPMRISQRNMRALYERTWASLEQDEDDEDFEEIKEEEGWAPAPIIRKYLRAHFLKRPFDKIRLGILKIVTKAGKLVWFEPNDEQRIYLKSLEDKWYHGEYFAGIALKARQIGSSTFWTAVNYCIQSTQSRLTSHVVMHIQETAEGILDMFKVFHEEEPYWVRPPIVRKDPLVLHGNGVKRAKVKIESAERRERVSRSITVQLRHCSEVPYWAEPEATFNAMIASAEFAWPLIHIEESTGKNINDVFYNRFYDAQAGKMDGFESFFFPWFQHSAYKKALPSGLSEAAFRMTLDEADIAMWEKFSLTKEQVYWYVTRRSREVNSGKLTNDLFKREYPCTVEEAFIGASSNFFEPSRSKMDLYRTRNENRVLVKLEELKKSVSGFANATSWQVPVPYAKCVLHTDIQNGCNDPKFTDDARMGQWVVNERPRLGHRYIVSGDIRRGKLAQKNVHQSSDFDSLGVWRYTYEPDEPAAMVQVAYFHGKFESGPIELAEHAVAASTIYRDEANGGERALLVLENNSHGLAAVEEAKRLGANQYQRVEYGKTGEEIGRSLGFTTTTGGEAAQGSKNHLLMRFRREWMQDRIIVLSPQTVQEMSVFINNDGKLEAMAPYHDDTVMEAALAVEGVKYAEGEIAPVPVNIGQDNFMQILEEEMLVYEQAEKVDRRKLLESIGARVSKMDGAGRSRSKWL